MEQEKNTPASKSLLNFFREGWQQILNANPNANNGEVKITTLKGVIKQMSAVEFWEKIVREVDDKIQAQNSTSQNKEELLPNEDIFSQDDIILNQISDTYLYRLIFDRNNWFHYQNFSLLLELINILQSNITDDERNLQMQLIRAMQISTLPIENEETPSIEETAEDENYYSENQYANFNVPQMNPTYQPIPIIGIPVPNLIPIHPPNVLPPNLIPAPILLPPPNVYFPGPLPSQNIPLIPLPTMIVPNPQNVPLLPLPTMVVPNPQNIPMVPLPSMILPNQIVCLPISPQGIIYGAPVPQIIPQPPVVISPMYGTQYSHHSFEDTVPRDNGDRLQITEFENESHFVQENITNNSPVIKDNVTMTTEVQFPEQQTIEENSNRRNIEPGNPQINKDAMETSIEGDDSKQGEGHNVQIDEDEKSLLENLLNDKKVTHNYQVIPLGIMVRADKYIPDDWDIPNPAITFSKNTSFNSNERATKTNSSSTVASTNPQLKVFCSRDNATQTDETETEFKMSDDSVQTDTIFSS